MRKMRRGFTLVELLVVIAVIAILSTMAVVGGSEANNIAQANKVVEEFKIIGAAMNMYYADNRATCDTAEVAGLPTTIKDGLAPYVKNADSIETATVETSTVGKYNITVNDQKQWWLSYKLPETNSKVAQILANKAVAEGLKASAAESASTTTGTGRNAVTTTTTNPYVATGDTVYMRVR